MTDGSPAGRHPLANWVEWLVEQYELWERIPQCWSKHPAAVAELQVMLDLHDGTTVAPDVAQAIAGWHDQLGRVLDRLSHSPAARCVQQGEHRPARTWSRMVPPTRSDPAVPS